MGTIVAAALKSAAERERVCPRAALERAAEAITPRAELFQRRLREDRLCVIAECKRRSPSKGVLRREYEPAAIARSYERGGAAAISVLTEPTFFDGSLDHLRAVREAVALPILRKDFIVSDYQIIEARLAGADAVLLIVAALDDVALGRLMATAETWGLATLVEVHAADELERAVHAGATTVGINSRNLRTLEVDVSVFDRLIPGVPSGVAAVAESGVSSIEDVRRLRRSGFDAFLIGERFMTAADPGDALRAWCILEVCGDGNAPR